MALTVDDNCGFSHEEASMIREWIFWGREIWTPESFTFHASYKSRSYAAPQSISKEGFEQASENQRHTPLHMMTVGSRQWWWYKDTFYYTSDSYRDPEIIKGLLLQKEQRARNKEERARAAASGQAPPRQSRAKTKKSDPVRSPASQTFCPYAVLGVPRTASSVEIRTAYRQRINEYHPDKVAALGVELKRLAEEMSKQINRAYEILR